MKKINLLFIAVSLVLASCGGEKKEPAKETSPTNDSTVTEEPAPDTAGISNYYGGEWINRNKNNPFFRSTKVDQMVRKKEKFQPEQTDEIPMDYDVDYLEKNELAQLTTRELIYYCLAYKNSFSQICAGGVGEGDTLKGPMIPRSFPFDYSGLLMSNTQRKALEERKDSVITVITNFMLEHSDRIDQDYLEILDNLHAVKAIPAVISTASEKNLLNYTLLLSLMYDMKYKPLRESPLFEKLYGDDAYTYGEKIPATPENRKLIVDMARAFHKGGKEM